MDKTGNEEYLSAHFTLSEMLRSGIAIRFDIDNSIRSDKELHTSAAQIKRNLTDLCQNVLEPLRGRVGRVIVTSAYRCPELNMVVNGAKKSQHRYGEAADIYFSSREQCEKYVRVIKENGLFDQLILEPQKARQKRWLHVSFSRRHRNRCQVIGDNI